jgi:glycine/D-amino acid oxidase-like deaminating enzyme
MNRAIVVGGGIGGLLAARVLRRHGAREVLLVDADVAYGLGAARTGVPQGTQLHVLLQIF